MGVKLGVLLNRLGLVVGWVWATDNMHDKHFAVLVEAAREQMVVLADHGFHATVGDPPNLKLCQRGQWNERMLVETVLENADHRCPSEKTQPPGGCLPSGALGFQHGVVQSLGSMAWVDSR
ncbi:MAG: hypothetical protein U1F68_00655 [Gammaproteobacteria bacterium]